MNLPTPPKPGRRPDRPAGTRPLVLGKLGGKVRVATRAAPQARPLADAGDTLSMRATLIPGPSAPAVDGSQDFFVRVTAAGKEVALVFVPAPGFTAKGKRLVASRDDTCDTRSKRCKGDTSQSCTTPADCTSGKKSIQAFAPDATDPDLEKLSGTPMLGGSIVLKRARRAIHAHPADAVLLHRPDGARHRPAGLCAVNPPLVRACGPRGLSQPPAGSIPRSRIVNSGRKS